MNSIILLETKLTSRGADTNIMSYATIKDGLPLMPTYINNVRSKLESVVQSIFTNNITRQTIPGFHASQVSTTGMRKLDLMQVLHNLNLNLNMDIVLDVSLNIILMVIIIWRL